MGYLRLYVAFIVYAGHMHSLDLMPDGWLPHVRSGGVHGAIKVHFFFMLSGFFVHLMVREKFPGAPLRFYASRLLRLLPAYYLALAATYIFYLAAGYYPYDVRLEHALKVAQMNTEEYALRNITLYYPELLNPYRSLHGLYFLVGPAWSLAVEMLFLIIAPFALAAIARTWYLLYLSALLAGFCYYYGVIRVNFLAELIYFAAGALLYPVYLRLKAWPATAGRRHLAILCALAIALALAYHVRLQQLLGTGIFHVSCLLFMAASIPIILAWFPTHRAERFAGEMSYPFYLFHLLVMGIAAQLGVEKIPFALYSLAGSLMAAAVIARYVDLPLRQVRRRLECRSSPLTAKPIQDMP